MSDIVKKVNAYITIVHKPVVGHVIHHSICIACLSGQININLNVYFRGIPNSATRTCNHVYGPTFVSVRPHLLCAF